MEAQKQISLLDYLTRKVGCGYVCNLHYLNTKGKQRLISILEKIRTEDYTLREWNDALDYLTGETNQNTSADARALLIFCLSAKEEKKF